MRWIKTVVLTSLFLKILVLGAWWLATAASAERATAPGAPPAGQDDVAKAGKPAPPATEVPTRTLVNAHGLRMLLSSVKERNADLDTREKTLVEREATLKKLEKAITDAIGQLEGRGGEGCALSTEAVGKVYASMKAEEAAPIIDRLDDTTAKAILSRLKEKQIGAILAAMSRERAVALTKALAATRPAAP